MLVIAARAMPSFGNQYAAIGGWDTQLTDRPVQPDRPVNLRRPADDEHDHGAHGGFDQMAGGFTDPAFLSSLPQTAKVFGRATGRTLREKAQRWRHHRP
jgi:hypothetical protein